MQFPVVTAFFAGAFGLVYVILSVWVVSGRVSLKVLVGDGGKEPLLRRVRAHANFAEFVPFILFLAALTEMSASASHATMQALLGMLLLARVLQPFGMLAAKNSPRQFVCRGGAIIVTLIVMLVFSILLLMRMA